MEEVKKRGRPKKVVEEVKPVETVEQIQQGTQEMKDKPLENTETLGVTPEAQTTDNLKADLLEPPKKTPMEVLSERQTGTLVTAKEQILYKFICGTCHTSIVCYVDNGKLTNRTQSIEQLHRKVNLSKDVEAVEVLCKKCGCISFRIIPKVDEYKTMKEYKNLCLKIS